MKNEQNERMRIMANNHMPGTGVHIDPDWGRRQRVIDLTAEYYSVLGEEA